MERFASRMLNTATLYIFGFFYVVFHISTCNGNIGNNLTSLPLVERPNIVIFLADDMGIGDLSCYGNTNIKTPNIDKLAENGIKFTRMYSQHFCTPSRASLLTGRLPSRNGLIQGRLGIPVIVSPNQEAGLPHDEITLPEFLNKEGYTTAAVGKWHVGMGPQGEYLPTNKGFESFYGIPLTHIEPCSSYTEMDTGIMFNIIVSSQKWAIFVFIIFVTSLRVLRIIGSKGLLRFLVLVIIAAAGLRIMLFSSAANPSSCLLMRDDEIIEQPYKDVNMTLRMTSETINVINKLSQIKKPMFLYVNYLTPHYPALVSSRFNGSSGFGPYYDSILEMDWSIGIIIDALAKNNMKNNLILFTSDNGPAPITGFSNEPLDAEHLGSTRFRDEEGKVHQLRGWKGSNYEGGIRIPAMIQWSGVISPRVVGGITSHMDILPTVMELLGKDNNDSKIDGKSLVPLLKSSSVDSSHDVMFHYCSVKLLGAVSYKQYKLMFMDSADNYSCSGNVFKNPHLYDLSEDPSETKSISLNNDVLAEIYKVIEDHEKTMPALYDRYSQLDRLVNPFSFPCSNFPRCTTENKERDDFSNLPI